MWLVMGCNHGDISVLVGNWLFSTGRSMWLVMGCNHGESMHYISAHWHRETACMSAIAAKYRRLVNA